MTEKEKINSLMIQEVDFRKTMEEKVEPWVKAEFTTGKFESYDGTKIAYYYNVNPEEKATVVIVHGFGEFFPKFYEMAYYFYHMGYSVFFLEHRGYGYSDRAVPEYDHIYVKSYDEYVLDLKEYMDQIVMKESKTKKCYLFSHSMGGCISSLFLEEYQNYFEKAVLSSPLHKMDFGGFKEWQVKMLAGFSKILGWNNKIIPGQREFDGINVWEKSSSVSKARYDYQFDKRLEIKEYQTYGGTYAWVRATLKATDKCLENASKIEIPLLLCEAGKDTLVDNLGHEMFVKQAKNVQYEKFPESKHEIFNGADDVRDDYFERVFAFLDK